MGTDRKKPEFPLVQHHPMKRWRFDRGVTLTRLAGYLKPRSSAGYLQQIESGSVKPLPRLVKRICDVTGLRPEDFDRD